MDQVIDRLEKILDEMRNLGPDFAEALTGGVLSADNLGRARGRVTAR
ncbi:hypothetical protein [Micromonospora tarensis]|uniref:Uncharacterized protein n=1 Tax=Micromonospora tarensis TaxID=2806100 RepID=A0ABS1YEL4_9ACTN|nr:hypothetical protein [Micromonospora tarensis]MBM0275792.1 hypothetical protein [Micromonospora tarensis]